MPAAYHMTCFARLCTDFWISLGLVPASLLVSEVLQGLVFDSCSKFQTLKPTLSAESERVSDSGSSAAVWLGEGRRKDVCPAT